VGLLSFLGAAALGATGVYLGLRTWLSSGPPESEPPSSPPSDAEVVPPPFRRPSAQPEPPPFGRPSAEPEPPPFRPPTTEPPDIDLPSRSPLRRLIVYAVIIGALVVGGFFVYRLWFAGEEATEQRFTTVTASTMTLRATIATTGTAEAVDETAVTFPIVGNVAEILVGLGDDVKAGQPLARLDVDDLESAVAKAEANLSLANIRLRQLLKGADAADLAAADDAVAAAQAIYDKAANDLADLLEGPGEAEIAAADDTVERAEANLESARDALDRITEPASDAQISAADNVIETAKSGLEKAQAELRRLREGASAAELAAAEQKAELAQAELETARSNLDALISGPSPALLAAAEAEVALADANLNAAENAESSAQDTFDAIGPALESVLKTYCASADSDPLPCTPQDIPLSDTEVEAVIDSACTQSGQTDCVEVDTVAQLVTANTSYLTAEDTLDTAQNQADAARFALEAAEESLAELQEPASASDLAAAKAAVASAEAGLEAAQAAFDELNAGADPQDIVVAEAAADAAEAALLSALDSYSQLFEPPDPTEVAAAEAAVSSAEQALEAAELARDELVAGPTARDIANAQAGVESAQASLEAAKARRADLLAGADLEDIQAQQEQVRLAGLSLEDAKRALEDATLTAPFDGEVSALPISVGELVGPTLPAVTLLTPGAIQLTLTVGETELPEIKKGQTGVIQFDAIQGRSFIFNITALGLSPQIQQGVVTYVVEASLRVGDGVPADQRPAPGMNGSAVVITRQKPDALAIPSRAIRRRGDEQIVEVLVDGEVVPRTVETGLTDGENTEILSGLEAGEEVVLRGAGPGEAAETATPEKLPEGIR
jgi:multidrug efflux pump subunit AcrA (membrane-fusion protein)